MTPLDLAKRPTPLRKLSHRGSGKGLLTARFRHTLSPSKTDCGELSVLCSDPTGCNVTRLNRHPERLAPAGSARPSLLPPRVFGMRKAKACYILDEPTGSMGLGTTAVQHGWAFGQSLRLILLATNTNPLPLLLPQHRGTDRKIMHLHVCSHQRLEMRLSASAASTMGMP